MKKLMPFIALALVGCGHVNTKDDFEKLKTMTSHNLEWVQSDEDQLAVQGLIDGALSQPLTSENAVKIALMNNGELQAEFEDIGVSKADLVQAGLFTNPSLSAMWRFPFSGNGTNLEFEAFASLTDLWLIPLKKKKAEAALEKTMLRVADKVMVTVRDAQLAFQEVYFKDKIYLTAKRYLERMRSLYAEAQNRKAFGYMTDLDVYQTKVALDEALIMEGESRVELDMAKAELIKVLGLNGESFRLDGGGLASMTADPAFDQAFESALANRFDLHMARKEIDEKARSVDLESAMIFKAIHLGGNIERGTSGDKEAGPVFDLELPIFDQNNAQHAKAQFELRQSTKAYKARTDMLRRDIANLLTQMKHQRFKVKTLAKSTLPMHQKSVGFLQKWAAVMQVNRFMLLEAQKNQIHAQMDHLIAEKELYHLSTQLNYEMGGMR